MGLWVPVLRDTYNLQIDNTWGSLMTTRADQQSDEVIRNYLRTANNVYRITTLPGLYTNQMPAENECIIKGCTRPAKRRGMCQVHYSAITGRVLKRNIFDMTAIMADIRDNPIEACVRCGTPGNLVFCAKCLCYIQTRVRRVALYHLYGEIKDGL